MKAYLLVIFTFVTLALSAQSHRFADSTAQWNVLQSRVSVTSPYSTVTYSYIVDGDTSFDGFNYQKISANGLLNIAEVERVNYIRRDSLGRVYSYHKPDNQEYLIYDFSKQPGDTIEIHSYAGWINQTYHLVVTAVDTVYYGRNRIRQHFGSIECIEGMGMIYEYTSHPFYPMIGEGVFDAWIYRLLCFHENGQRVYYDDKYDTCVYNRIWNGINEVANENVSLSPNPTSNNFTLTLSQQPQLNTTLLIHDAIGRLMKQEELTTTSQLVSVTDLPNGMYTYTVTENRVRQASGKLVVSH